MICPNCKKQIDEDSNFCKYCGNKVVVANKCPHCGATPLPKDAKFCPDCGTHIESATKEIVTDTFLLSPLYLEMLSIIKDFGDACDMMEAPIYGVDEENLEFYYNKFEQCRNVMSKFQLIAKKHGVLDEWIKRNIYFPPSNVGKTRNKGTRNVKVQSPLDFASNNVLPYWPQRGKEQSVSYYDKLIADRKQISDILKQNISHKYASYYRFIDTCIKAVLDISEGRNPCFREYIRYSNDQRNFWENMKVRFGEKNYNRFFHYHSGDFAEELCKAMRNMYIE